MLLSVLLRSLSSTTSAPKPTFQRKLWKVQLKSKVQVYFEPNKAFLVTMSQFKINWIEEVCVKLKQNDYRSDF